MEHDELQSNVRILATLHESEYPVVSCYLNAEQGVSQCRSYLAERIPLLRRTLPKKQREAFDHSMLRINDYVDGHALDPGVRGMVIFARSIEEPFFAGMTFPVPVPNQLAVDGVPHICQLVALKNTYDRYVIILMTKTRASILEVNLGAVTMQTWSEIAVAPDRIGREWSKERYQRHRQQQTDETIREKIRTVDGLMRAAGHSHLILAGEPTMVDRLKASLPSHLLQKVVDSVPARSSDHPRDVVKATLSSFTDYQQQKSYTYASMLQQAVYSNGLGVLGTEASLQCLRHARADVLLLAEEYSPGPAWQCRTCGVVQIGRDSPDACPECSGVEFRDVTLKEELVRLAEVSSCAVKVVENHPYLVAGGGVGCLTRY